MEFRPHKYQEYAREFIIGHPVCALILDMGLGKTVITLTALWELALDYFEERFWSLHHSVWHGILGRKNWKNGIT